MKKQVKLYPSEDVLVQFYSALASNNSDALKKVHIPKSDVFYVREKIFQDTGEKYTLDRVERAMYLEGHLKASDVFEPKRKRDWE